MNNSLRPHRIFLEIIRCASGTFLVGTGVAMFLACKMGSDSITVFLDGMSATFGFNPSIVDQCLTIFFLIGGYWLNKKNVGILTILYVLFIGLSIEFGTKITELIGISSLSGVLRFSFFLLGEIFIALGYTLFQLSKYGMCADDAFALGISQKLNQPYLKVRIIFDLSFFLLGISLKGIYGIGTLFAIFTIGPLVTIFKNIFKIFIEKT